MNRSITGQNTGIKVECIDPEFRTHKGHISGQITVNLGDRCIPEASKSHMRKEVSPFRFKAQTNKNRLHPVSQNDNRINGINARPQDMRLPARREKTESSKPHGKSKTLYIGKLLPYLLENSIIHLTDKTQSKMDLLILHPARTGQTGTDPCQFQFYSLR